MSSNCYSFLCVYVLFVLFFSGIDIISTSTGTTPDCIIPNSFAAIVVTSITLPFINGPLSLIRTVTVLSLFIFFTLTIVPKGSVLCAAV